MKWPRSVLGIVGLCALPVVALADIDTTTVTLRADAIAKGYTVVHSTGTVWIGVPQRAIRKTKKVRVKIAPIQHPEKFDHAAAALSDIYRYSIQSKHAFRIAKPLHIRMSYGSADSGTAKVLKYWNADQQRWRRIKRASDDANSLTMSGQLRAKQAIVAIFPKSSSSTVVQGLASWYDWTGAACNDFPVGSVIRVTNVDTAASVDTTVVSTGPFIPGRVVDLPREDFSQIADVSAGVIEVTVQRIK